MIYIIGCGGGGSWLAPSLCLLHGKENVTLIDGDTLEPKNLNRQLFTMDDCGENKAKALAKRYDCLCFPDWYNCGVIAHSDDDWLMVCVDNNPARLSALEACDRYGCQAIFAANETTSAEAYFYRPDWAGQAKRDPRLYYPTLLTNKENDPQAIAIGCTGEAQEQNRQLVSANFMSAALAQHLFVLWAMEYPAMGQQASVRPHLPFRLIANLSNLETHKVGADE